MKVLNSILNFLWRLVSFIGIVFAGMILVVASREHMVDWAFHVSSITILITSFGFGIWQCGWSKDVFHISWKTKKDKKDGVDTK
jgi:hypothetical protein